MSQTLQVFSDWLAATPASTTVQDVTWIIPTVQTVHILGISVVMASALLVHLRVLGVMGGANSLNVLARRFFPWIWVTLVVLLLSGSILIVGEPGRSIQNPAFIAKMAMLVIVVALSLAFDFGLRRNPQYWEISTARRASARLIAATSLALLVAIVFAGRWIAYIAADSEG